MTLRTIIDALLAVAIICTVEGVDSVVVIALAVIAVVVSLLAYSGTVLRR